MYCGSPLNQTLQASGWPPCVVHAWLLADDSAVGRNTVQV
jgi:hypothetical protein